MYSHGTQLMPTYVRKVRAHLQSLKTFSRLALSNDFDISISLHSTITKPSISYEVCG